MNRSLRNDRLGTPGDGLPVLENPIPIEQEQSPEVNPINPIQPTQQPKTKKKVIRCKLTYEQKRKAIQIIKEEFVKIEQEYSTAEHLENADKALKEYELSKEYLDFPTDNAANQKVALLTIAADITASKVKRQVCTPKPMTLLEMIQKPSIDMDKDAIKSALRDREEYLDGILRNDAKFEEYVPVWARMSCVQGTSLIKTVIDGETDWYVEGEDEQGNPIERKQQCFYGCKPYRVKLENFMARLSISDFKKHKVIGEKLENFTFVDIEQRLENGYWDEEAVEEIKSKLGEKYTDTTFNFYECIVYADLINKGQYRRFVITFDDETETIVRSIYYPYKHGKINYTPIVSIKNDQSWAGYSYWKRLEDVISICEKYVRYKINSFTLSHKPVVFIDDEQFDASRMTINKNINVFKAQKGTNVTPIKYDMDSYDSTQSLSFFMNLADLITGVSAALMSGRETPNDPRAPASKTAMKLQESNMRVEDTCMNMEAGFAEIVEQIDKNYFQFVNSDETEVSYMSDNEPKTLPIDIFNIPVRYVMHGSRVAFDKGLDLQINLQTAEYTQKLFPEIWNDYQAKLVFARNIYNNSEGSVEQNKSTILKPLEKYAENALKQQQMIKQTIDGMRAQGIPDEQIKEVIEGRQPMPMQGQGMQPTIPAQPPAVPIPNPSNGMGGIQ